MAAHTFIAKLASPQPGLNQHKKRWPQVCRAWAFVYPFSIKHERVVVIVRSWQTRLTGHDR
jgi:hypothetical protein